MRVHRPRLQHSFLLRLKPLFLLIFYVFLFMVLMELHCNKSSFFCSIASMILGALAAIAQMKVKRLLAHKGIQSLLIGIFIYTSMTIDTLAIVLALWQTPVKYIADLGALAKTNPILAITFSITMFSDAGIPPLAGFLGVVTSVIGCWAARRLPRVSQFGRPKAVLRASDT
ncbi:hypothetical protein M9H77_23617 [Catharanthus roseus]|uniref:Uncharacterized protein n=1 Tax=Catharanthus roseus TaxID=4058 RepID=A0ACC0AUS3_CATRO|nr:hypothetical protein M9H77_23617 [Catharanthus roseus]